VHCVVDKIVVRAPADPGVFIGLDAKVATLRVPPTVADPSSIIG
jgi:hypothetical protein